MNMTTIRRSFGALALCLLSSGLASANTLTYYVDVFGLGTYTTSPINPATSTLANADSSAILSIPKLNQLGGVNEGTPSANHIWQLTQVAINLNWRSLATFQVVNISTTNYTFTGGYTQVPIMLTGPDSTQNNVLATAGPASGTALGLPSPQPTNFPGQSGSNSNTQNASNLSFYQGAGSGNYNVSVNTGSFSATGTGQSGSAGKLFYGGDGQAGAILSITYTYSEVAVPEPGTTMLLGGGLMGIGAVLYRRRKKA